MNKCPKCGSEYNEVIVTSSETGALLIKPEYINTRWCVNRDCENFGVFEVKCRVCKNWFDSEKDKCPFCNYNRKKK